MADVRALLKARRQEARISHPLASYTTNGQLQCIACGTTVKHGSSWEGHIGSKSHRVNAARLRDQQQQRLTAKRKTREADPGEQDVDMKRQKVDDGLSLPSVPPLASTGLPADFFSDPAQAPPPPSSDNSDDEAPAPSTAVDLEWEKFQQTVLNPPDTDEAYERATVFAEPVLAAETPEGFPPAPQKDSDSEPVRAQGEVELRKRKEQEEKELIMDRLLDEERAQEEADAKVSALKTKLDALRRQREAARASQSKK